MDLTGAVAVEAALSQPLRDMPAPEDMTALTEAPLRQVRSEKEGEVRAPQHAVHLMAYFIPPEAGHGVGVRVHRLMEEAKRLMRTLRKIPETEEVAEVGPVLVWPAVRA
jgi:hypothetical protein